MALSPCSVQTYSVVGDVDAVRRVEAGSEVGPRAVLAGVLVLLPCSIAHARPYGELWGSD